MYRCWSCGAWFGEPGTEEPSQLCPACKRQDEAEEENSHLHEELAKLFEELKEEGKQK